MQSFRTEINSDKSNFKISHSDKIITIGSCFSENIGKRLSANKFNVTINPFGILYNPVSIYNCLDIIMENRLFSESDLFFHNEQWHSFYHHGSFSSHDKTACLNNINQSIENANKLLKTTNFIIITFGSAYVYEDKTSQNIVANCHKIPEKNFSQYLLDLEDINKLWQELINRLNQFNPSLKIIFTVSPIRYLKYGFALNQVSKSLLLLAVNSLKNEFENIDYFPSYEIMMDDLRDYRFYEEDMIHPNKIAINYIWEKISDSYFDNETKKVIENIKKISDAKNHRPRNPDSEAHQNFLKNQLKLIKQLEEIYSAIDFSDETNYFSNLINNS